MGEAAWKPDRSVAAHDRQCLEARSGGPLGVDQTVLQGMLARQERNDGAPELWLADVGVEVREILLLVRADRVVGDQDEASVRDEPPHRVAHVDPRVDAGGPGEAGLGRAQLHRREHTGPPESFDERVTGRVMSGARAKRAHRSVRAACPASPAAPAPMVSAARTRSRTWMAESTAPLGALT